MAGVHHAIAAETAMGASRTITRSVRAFSHSCSVRPFASKNERISPEPQPNTCSSIGPVTENIVAQHGAPRDARELRVLGDGNRESVAIVHVQHHVHVGAPVADVDRPRGRTSNRLSSSRSPPPAVAGRDSADRLHLASALVMLELRSEDAVGRHDAVEGRLDDFARRAK